VDTIYIAQKTHFFLPRFMLRLTPLSRRTHTTMPKQGSRILFRGHKLSKKGAGAYGSLVRCTTVVWSRMLPTGGRCLMPGDEVRSSQKITRARGNAAQFRTAQ